MDVKESELNDLTGEILELSDLVDYQEGAIVSRSLVDRDTGTMTVFAFDENQSISEHTAPYDALVQALDGSGRVTISGNEHEIESGDSIVIPKDEPHSLESIGRFKVFLTMIK